MTVTTTSALSGPFAPNGVVTSFPFTFAAQSASDVAVARASTTGSVTTLSGYTVAITPTGGGSVNFAVAPPVGDPIFIFSNPSFQQQTNLANQGNFSATAIDVALDQAAIRDIALMAKFARTMVAPVGETLAPLPSAATRRNTVLSFDANGNPSVTANVAKGDPGGNVLAIGLFTVANTLSIPLGTDRVETSGYASLGVGAEDYIADNAVDAAYVTANPTTSFISANGRGFRVMPDGECIRGESFGISAIATDNYAAINAARTIANLLKKKLKLPPGTLIINQATPSWDMQDNEWISGSGKGATVLHFTGLASVGTIFSATNKSGVRISNLKMEASVLQTGGQVAVSFTDCNDCLVEDCIFDKWTNSVIFWTAGGGIATGPIPPGATNLRNKAMRCVSLSSRSYGFFLNFSTACALISCEAYGATNQDGFKFGGGTMFAMVIGCHAEGCNGDGFDTYDGFIASVMADCTSFNNTSNGFQIKGTLGGTYTAGDYVTRQSVFANLTSRGNALAGFLFQETRRCVVSGLVATGNGTSGFILNNIQDFMFGSCLATQNTQHGWSLIGSTSRCGFVGCAGIDNSYVDGTIQNGTYDGWNFSSASTCWLSGCVGHNGTQSGKLGGQGYGFNMLTSTGIRVTGGGAAVNVTGPVGGTNPYAGNSFTSFDAGGSFISFTPSIQALTSASSVTPTFSNDLVKITAQAVNLSLQAPTGVPLGGKRLAIRIKDNGTIRTIGYDAQYRAMDVALPTATVAGKLLYLDMIYNADDVAWDVIRVAQQA